LGLFDSVESGMPFLARATELGLCATVGNADPLQSVVLSQAQSCSQVAVCVAKRSSTDKRTNVTTCCIASNTVMPALMPAWSTSRNATAVASSSSGVRVHATVSSPAGHRERQVSSKAIGTGSTSSRPITEADQARLGRHKAVTPDWTFQIGEDEATATLPLGAPR
jgi:hypothetical protein